MSVTASSFLITVHDMSMYSTLYDVQSTVLYSVVCYLSTISSLYAKALAALSLAVAAFFAHACRSVPLMALDAEGAGAARGAEEASDAVMGFSLALVAGGAAVTFAREPRTFARVRVAG